MECALQQWQRLGTGVCPLTRGSSTAAVRVRPGPPLSLTQSFVLAVVLRGLAVWHLHVRGALSFPPPSALPTRVGPVTNVFACQGTDTEEVSQIVDALATEGERVVFVFPAPRAFALSEGLVGMRWYTVSSVYVIMSRTVTHTSPLGHRNLHPTWEY